MSTQISNLQFFDKEGYPYNFLYDNDTKQWNGKLFFEENSSDTFRTLCIYVFENVPSFNFNTNFEFRDSQLFNYSGVTFTPQTYDNETITNIRKVNSNSSFYSKWVHGERFDKKFPIGTVVTFSGVTGTGIYAITGNTSDFNSGLTFNVIGNQRNAFLICTETDNSIFDLIFSGGTVSSNNIIKIPNYNNSLYDLTELNYYNGKKLSIYGSDNNDGVYTYEKLDTLKNSIYDFQLTGTSTGNLTVDFYLMTQRPELYEGNVIITYNDQGTSGTTIEFLNGINTNINITSTGQTIIFETPEGEYIHPSNPQFTITGYIDRETVLSTPLSFYVTESVNNINCSGITTITGLTVNDIIELTDVYNPTGLTLHNKRQFQVTHISGGTLQVDKYIIPESGVTYRIDKVINKKKIKKIYAQQIAVTTPSGYTNYVICYSTTNRITMSQEIINSGTTTHYYENTVSSMRNKYKSLLTKYGIDIYHHHHNNKNYLIFDGLDYSYEQFYSGLTVKINNDVLSSDNIFKYLSGATYIDSDIYHISVTDSVVAEKVYFYEDSKLAQNFMTEIYFNIQRDSTTYGFNLTINEVDFYISLDGTDGTYSQSTINSFINNYYTTFDKQGITIYSGYTNATYTGCTLILEGQLPNIELINIKIKVNNYSTYGFVEKIINHSIIISSNELYAKNSNLYDFELSTGMIINVNGCEHSLNNKQYNILGLTGDTEGVGNIIQLSYQGPFLYEDEKYLDISVNEYLRAPRGRYGRDVKYKFSWMPIEENDPQISDDIFYYDYSGTQLKDNGKLTYIGSKPLWRENSTDLIFLNRDPNPNLINISDPSSQQTIFDELNYTLERLDSTTNFNYIPIPMQVFLGFNSANEGYVTNNMLIEKVEDIIFSGTTSSSKNFIISGNTITYVNNIRGFDFQNYGFEVDQLLSLDFREKISTGHTIFNNYFDYTIVEITQNKIKFKETLNYFTTSGKTFDYIIKTEPITIGIFNVFGETEIEDVRFVQHLKLLGANLNSDVQKLFKESDINDAGIDYGILNKKRKELLTVYPEIYNYIGAYKALINAINFFGYNDLELYEYYRNINPKSPLYGKLQKTLIEDIFDNTIPGWSEMEFDNKNYLKTNLFNLTYQITDFDGTPVNMYSLDEVQLKLAGMVKWLRKNIIPLSANILDITGVSNARNTMYINYDASNYVKKIVVDQQTTAINFTHIQTLNIDTNYLFTINFYLTEDAIMPSHFTVKIRTFYLDSTTSELVPVQYFSLFKTDLSSFGFNVDRIIDPYMYIEIQSYNDYGFGYTNTKLFDYNEGRNFILINNNFSGVNYKYVTTDYGYYIISDGRFYIIPYQS